MPSRMLLLFVSAILTAPASATAIVSVKDAFWRAHFSYYQDGATRLDHLPEGLVLECFGTAMAADASGCSDRASALAVSDSGAMVSTTVERAGGLRLSNLSGTAFPGVFAFATEFSAFHPDGEAVSLDNAAKEYAAFFSVVSGPNAFDLKGCEITGRASPAAAAKTYCTAPPPGLRISSFTLGPLDAFAELSAGFDIAIRADARGEKQNGDPVPEVPAALLFVSAFFVAVTAYRRKARSPCRQNRLLCVSTGLSHRPL